MMAANYIWKVKGKLLTLSKRIFKMKKTMFRKPITKRKEVIEKMRIKSGGLAATEHYGKRNITALSHKYVLFIIV